MVNKSWNKKDQTRKQKRKERGDREGGCNRGRVQHHKDTNNLKKVYPKRRAWKKIWPIFVSPTDKLKFSPNVGLSHFPGREIYDI